MPRCPVRQDLLGKRLAKKWERRIKGREVATKQEKIQKRATGELSIRKSPPNRVKFKLKNKMKVRKRNLNGGKRAQYIIKKVN